MDKTDAIAVAISSMTPLSAPINKLHERARASLVERALDLAGFAIVPKKPSEAAIIAAGRLIEDQLEVGTYGARHAAEAAYEAMVSAAS